MILCMGHTFGSIFVSAESDRWLRKTPDMLLYGQTMGGLSTILRVCQMPCSFRFQVVLWFFLYPPPPHRSKIAIAIAVNNYLRTHVVVSDILYYYFYCYFFLFVCWEYASRTPKRTHSTVRWAQVRAGGRARARGIVVLFSPVDPFNKFGCNPKAHYY